MQTSDTSEKGLENIIEKHLIDHNGYRKSYNADYDRDLCIDKELLFEFIKETQPIAYNIIFKKGEQKFIKKFTDQIHQKGIIEVLRKGIKYFRPIQLYYKKPVSNLNEKTQKQYNANIFSVTRQLHYSLSNSKSLDMVIFINGLPVSIFELKNQWTGQNVKHAIGQYQNDRDPKEPLFLFGRCMVYFAIDSDLVYMTTHLNSTKTFFLPFNKGDNNLSAEQAGGAGNPVNPNGLKTDYLWKDILTKENFSNIIENYAQIVEEKDEDTGKDKRKLIFPRYHQLRAVKSLLHHAKKNGVGQRYLIQHSAGSGKSNSITWLAHQLVSLHNTENTESVFDSVIVVTDRRVLDKQIRDNIKQFAQVNRVVEAIDKGSKQLKQALADGKKIIVTTVQKFPFIIDEIDTLPAKKFAIIIDEAHSSQSGETASKMNWVLSDKKTPYSEEQEAQTSKDIEDLINESIETRKMLKNGSYFAFTATPKNKTLETFGTKTTEGKFKALDTYTMKQAIEEGFILDVLKNYTTYQSYYKLNKAVEGNPKFETQQAHKKLKNYVESHPFSIMEKSKIMLAHFHLNISKQIEGKAKAMVVCESIDRTIKYFHAFKKYLKKINYPYKPIIAFSGTKKVDGHEVNEAILNGFPSNKIPQEFKKKEYRFLIVANKFQTGFDQPLLHTMYVDKKLADVQAVQTLSRLNRAYKPYKKDTFVMDFCNTTEDIKKAFEPFYVTTILSEETDANKLNDLQNALDNAQIYSRDNVLNFTELYFKKADRQELDPIIDKCVAQYKFKLSEKNQIDFYVKAKSFFRTYAFLSKLLPFNNVYWERLYWFLKFLIPKIKPEKFEDLAKGILETIDLDSYRLTRTTQENIALKGDEELDPTPPVMKGKKGELEFDELEVIINEFNTKFGIDNWKNSDKIKSFLFEFLPAKLACDKVIVNAIKNSDRQNAKITSDKKVKSLMIDIILEDKNLRKKFTDDPEFKRQYLEIVFKKTWNQVQINNKMNL